MNLSPTRIAAIDSAIQSLWQESGLCPDDHLTLAPLSVFVDALNIRLIEEAGLTLRKVAALLGKANRVLEVQGEDKPLAGFLYAEPLDAFLFVNAADPIARRRFSAAHELGHLVLHRHPDEIVFRDGLSFRFSPEEEAHRNAGESSFTAREEASSSTLTPGDLERKEGEANVFAARLLMPEAVCRRLWQQYSVQFFARPALLSRRLATDLLVSPLAMKIRLDELGLTS